VDGDGTSLVLDGSNAGTDVDSQSQGSTNVDIMTVAILSIVVLVSVVLIGFGLSSRKATKVESAQTDNKTQYVRVQTQEEVPFAFSPVKTGTKIRSYSSTVIANIDQL